MALEQNFETFSGNDVVLVVTVEDADAGDGSPLNLAGAQEVIWALAKRANATAILTKTLGDGVEITDAAAGEVEVTLTSADLEPLRGDYYHEMRVTNSAGQKATVMYGDVTLKINLIRT